MTTEYPLLSAAQEVTLVDSASLTTDLEARTISLGGSAPPKVLANLHADLVSFAERLSLHLSVALTPELAGARRFLKALEPFVAGTLNRGTAWEITWMQIAENLSDHPLCTRHEGGIPGTIKLHRFSTLAPSDRIGTWTLRSPISPFIFYLSGEQVINCVMEFVRSAELDCLSSAHRSIAELLLAANICIPATYSEPDHEARWEPADIYFHTSSRLWIRNDEFGGTYPFKGIQEPLPSFREERIEGAIRLYRPTWAEIEAHDIKVQEAIEWRRSVRMGDKSTVITLENLGSLLYRAARIRGVAEKTPNTEYESTSRPYPSGGAAYELEIYLSVKRVSGLKEGVYRYQPYTHSLLHLGLEDVANMIVSDAITATGGIGSPDLVFTFAARFGRVNWKYRRICYSTILKDVGALYQTMYIVATSMGIGCCALGSGRLDVLSRALNIDILDESPVGEMALVSSSKRIDNAARDVDDAIGWRSVNDLEWRDATTQPNRDFSQTK